MKLMFIRHAEPDYVHDSLTEKGEREAAYLADYLANVKIDKIYISPLGRAQRTAWHTLQKKNMQGETREYLREFNCSCPNRNDGRDRHCWDLRPQDWTKQEQLYDRHEWTQAPLLSGGNVEEVWHKATEGFDDLLAENGYIRDGAIYRCENNTDETIAIFCHFGIATVLMSHLLGVSPIPMLQGLCMLPSSVTTLVT
ncbi:MAG: histidine phosphatase family protein [Clostridia bacterium]|nr:histidine phosphatase family protein [Clostridia bacterium]